MPHLGELVVIDESTNSDGCRLFFTPVRWVLCINDALPTDQQILLILLLFDPQVF